MSERLSRLREAAEHQSFFSRFSPDHHRPLCNIFTFLAFEIAVTALIQAPIFLKRNPLSRHAFLSQLSSFNRTIQLGGVNFIEIDAGLLS